MPSSARSSSYVKENDIKFGISVASRVMHTGVVNGLRCRFCVAFGREAKVGSKRKASSPGSGQSWTVPFRYDNIENHVRTQHPLKWAEYEKAKMIWKYTSRYDECNKFFSHTNSIAASARSHFQSPDRPGQGRQQLVFTIDKSIVEVIIGEMMYASTDEDIPTTGVGDGDDDDASVVIDNDDDGGIDIASSRFCTAAEQDAVMNDRRVLAARKGQSAS